MPGIGESIDTLLELNFPEIILSLSFLFLAKCTNSSTFGKNFNVDGFFTSSFLSLLMAAIFASITPPVILKPFSVSSKLIGFSFSIFSNALAVLSICSLDAGASSLAGACSLAVASTLANAGLTCTLSPVFSTRCSDVSIGRTFLPETASPFKNSGFLKRNSRI